MNALTKASLDAERMYAAAAFAVKAAPASVDTVISDDATGSRHRPSMGHAAEQYKYFRGWVFAAIRPIMQRIAGQTIHVGRLTSQRMPARKSLWLKESLPNCFKSMGDQIEPLDTHPILDTLADPVGEMVPWALISTTVASLELTGRSLWWLPPDSTVLPVPSHWIKGRAAGAWEIQPPGYADPQHLDAQECVYFHYPHPEDPRAVFSPLGAAAEPVQTDGAIQRSQLRMFQRGINPKVVLTAGSMPGVPGGNSGQRPSLTTQQRSQLVNAIKMAYAGARNWEEPLILDSLIERVDTLGKSIAEMDFLQSGQQTKARIFQVFGVNPIIAGEIENANRAQATVANEHFCSGTVNPKIELMSQVLTQTLGPMFARSGERLVVWIEKCKPNDPEQRLKEWSLGLSRNAVTRNEYRRHILNLPDHPDGDELLSQVNGRP